MRATPHPVSRRAATRSSFSIRAPPPAPRCANLTRSRDFQTSPSSRYVDIGEEDDWSKPAPGASDDEMDEDGSAKKRKKGAKGEAVDAKKGKPVADKRDRQRRQHVCEKRRRRRRGRRQAQNARRHRRAGRRAGCRFPPRGYPRGRRRRSDGARRACRVPPRPRRRAAPLEPIPPAGAAAASVRSGHPRDDDEVHPRDALRAASGRGPRRARHPAGDVRG